MTTESFIHCRDTTGGPTEMPPRVNGFSREDDQLGRLLVVDLAKPLALACSEKRPDLDRII